MSSDDTIIVLLLFAFWGWVLAALCYGLWRGEAARRLDAQKREGVLVPRRKAVVRTPDQPAPEEVEAPERPGPENEARAEYIQRAVDEGYDAEAAGKDFDAMISSFLSEQPKF